MRRDTTGRLLTALRAPRGGTRLGHRLVAAAVTALGGVAIAANSPHLPGLSDRLVVVMFVVAAPLIALVRLLPGINVLLALIVGAAGSLVVNVLIAQAMLTADAWSPPAGVVAVGLTASVLWLVPSDHNSLPHTKEDFP
ncbi:hypothetical protein MWU77_02755 [Rhodococcus sp. F64268]|uniref:hypothetical protein n=1 Tax=Rhodococcus sp. F64268 TaxID=2926402 RepID=UPI001FF2064A|nr:hypothetical protein [Rhodococcus sp. F64268]MCK0089698.1 hypothetical protein [Rhodococcus sp. F64268]